MTEEEKKALTNLKFNCTNAGFSIYDGRTMLVKCRDIQIILNLIDRLQREIEEYEKDTENEWKCLEDM